MKNSLGSFKWPTPISHGVDHNLLVVVLFCCVINCLSLKSNLDLPNPKPGCGVIKNKPPTNTGIRFLVVFPNFPLKFRTLPEVRLSVSAYNPSGTLVKVDNGRQTQKFRVRRGKPVRFDYSIKAWHATRAFLIKSRTNIQVHVWVRYLSPANKWFSYSYWAVPRQAYDKRYYSMILSPRSPSKAFLLPVASEPGGLTTVLKPRRVDLKQYEFIKFNLAAADEIGNVVEADREIALFTGIGPVTNADIQDVMLEQLIPTRSYGLSYITTIPAGLPRDYFFKIGFVNRDADTTIKIIGQDVDIIKPGIQTELTFPINSISVNQIIAADSNKPIMAVQFVVPPFLRENLTAPQSMSLLTARENWDVKYIIYVPYTSTVVFFMHKNDKEYLYENDKPIQNVRWIDQTPDQGVQAVGYKQIAEGTWKFRTLPKKLKVKFGGWVYGQVDGHEDQSFSHSLGMVLPVRNCFPCRGTQCDGRDNDCDGRKNEEICDQKDNDGDGWIDEDCCGYKYPGAKLSRQEKAAAVAGSFLIAGIIVMAVTLVVSQVQ